MASFFKILWKIVKWTVLAIILLICCLAVFRLNTDEGEKWFSIQQIQLKEGKAHTDFKEYFDYLDYFNPARSVTTFKSLKEVKDAGALDESTLTGIDFKAIWSIIWPFIALLIVCLSIFVNNRKLKAKLPKFLIKVKKEA